MKEEKGGDEGNDGEGNAEETKAARSFVSFSLFKETMESWYPPLLTQGYDMMDPDWRGE